MFAVDAAGYHSARTEIRFTVPPQGTPVTAAPRSPEGIQPATSGPPAAPTVSYPAPDQRVPGPGVGIAGYAPGAGHVVFVAEGGNSLGAVPVAPDGGWSWDAGWAWPPGPHTVECHAVDAQGGESRRTRVSFHVVGAQAPAAAMYQAPRF